MKARQGPWRHLHRRLHSGVSLSLLLVLMRNGACSRRAMQSGETRLTGLQQRLKRRRCGRQRHAQWHGGSRLKQQRERPAASRTPQRTPPRLEEQEQEDNGTRARLSWILKRRIKPCHGRCQAGWQAPRLCCTWGEEGVRKHTWQQPSSCRRNCATTNRVSPLQRQRRWQSGCMP